MAKEEKKKICLLDTMLPGINVNFASRDEQESEFNIQQRFQPVLNGILDICEIKKSENSEKVIKCTLLCKNLKEVKKMKQRIAEARVKKHFPSQIKVKSSFISWWMILLMIFTQTICVKSTHTTDIECFKDTTENVCTLDLFLKRDAKIGQSSLDFNLQKLIGQQNKICDSLNGNRYTKFKKAYNNTHDMSTIIQENLFSPKKGIFPEFNQDFLKVIKKEELFDEEILIDFKTRDIVTTKLNLLDIDLEFSFFSVFRANTLPHFESTGKILQEFSVIGKFNIMNSIHSLRNKYNNKNNITITIVLEMAPQTIRAQFKVYHCDVVKCPTLPKKDTFILNLFSNRVTPIINKKPIITNLEALRCRYRILSEFSTTNFKMNFNYIPVVIVNKNEKDIFCYIYLAQSDTGNLPYLSKNSFRIEKAKKMQNLVCAINSIQSFISERVIYNNRRDKRNIVGRLITTFTQLFSRSASPAISQMSSAASRS